MRAPRLLLAAALVLTGLVLTPTHSTAAPAKPRVLVWGGTYGYHHTSIEVGQATMQQLALSTGDFDVTVTDNPLDLSMQTLQGYDVLMWVSTTGKPPITQQQRDDVIRWSQCGGGNIGIHAALDADYGWAEHAELFGAQFDSHPKTSGSGEAKMIVETNDAITKGWAGGSFMFDDEYYRWRTAKRVPGISLPRNAPGVEVLLSLDETTVGGDIQKGPIAYEHHQPIAWKKTFRGGGRVFYNNMGHSESTWSVPAYQTSLTEAVKWVSGKRPDAACLTRTGDVSTKLTPFKADKAQVGRACPLPAAVKPRSNGTWENSGAARRLTPTGDSQKVAAGIPGNLSWGAQTWVLDLASAKAASADLTVDLTWPVPTDDYDLSITTAWGVYAAHSLPGVTSEKLVLKDVPTCAILNVVGDNMYAVSQQGPTAKVTVVPRAAAAVRPVARPGTSTGAPSGGSTGSGSGSGLAATGGSPWRAAAALGVLVLALVGTRLRRRT